jgi:hypothetical protein
MIELKVDVATHEEAMEQQRQQSEAIIDSLRAELEGLRRSQSSGSEEQQSLLQQKL